jgi:hypothetical protein
MEDNVMAKPLLPDELGEIIIAKSFTKGELSPCCRNGVWTMATAWVSSEGW